MFTNNRKIIIPVIAVFLAILFYIVSKPDSSKFPNEHTAQTAAVQDASKEKDNSTEIDQQLRENFILNEAGKMDDSESNDWWLNSGGLVSFENRMMKTIQDELDESSKWYQDYRRNNPRDTDNGKHPQNIFRLVNRNKFRDLEQETYFRIIRDNLSQSRYRNQSNGLLHFNRYRDGDNLYYTGIRVDGFAVIKKKIKGKYYTMAYNRIFDGKYNRIKNPNLLLENTWLGLKSEVKNETDGSVSIKVFLDKNRSGNWELVAKARDNGKKYGGKAFLNEGYAGIRTDFMDVEFDDYKIEEMN